MFEVAIDILLMTMVFKNTNQLEESMDSTYDRKAEVKAFDDSKAGVKGLVESGLTKIPRMFHAGKLDVIETSPSHTKLSIPIIDLKDPTYVPFWKVGFGYH